MPSAPAPADRRVSDRLARQSFSVVESSVPPGVALGDWRRRRRPLRPRGSRPRRWLRRVTRVVLDPARYD